MKGTATATRPLTARELRGQVLDLLREHESAGPEGLPTSARFLFYELTQRGLIPRSTRRAKGADGAWTRER